MTRGWPQSPAPVTPTPHTHVAFKVAPCHDVIKQTEEVVMVMPLIPMSSSGVRDFPQERLFSKHGDLALDCLNGFLCSLVLLTLRGPASPAVDHQPHSEVLSWEFCNEPRRSLHEQGINEGKQKPCIINKALYSPDLLH